MEKTNKSSNQNVIGSQCSRPILLTSQNINSYTKEKTIILEKEDPNKIIQEKSDSNVPFLENNKELKNCKTIEDTTKVLVGFMQEGFNDFENRTGRKPTYSEMRAMYG